MDTENNREIHAIFDVDKEMEWQLGELSLPQEHSNLVKHLFIVSRNRQKNIAGLKHVSSSAVANPEKGAICIIPDFRWILGP